MDLHEFDRLKLLMDYTQFHIGLYATLITGLVALLGINQSHRYEAILIKPLAATLVFFVLAGMCGGIIASSIPEFYKFTEFWEAKIGFWDLKIMPAKFWARLEHGFFWMGIFITVISYCKFVFVQETQNAA